MACGVPNPGGKALPVDHGGQGKRGAGSVPDTSGGGCALFPKKREKEKAWEASPRPFLRFEEEEPRLRAVLYYFNESFP